MFTPKDYVQGLSKVKRSKFDKNVLFFFVFFCKTFHIFSIFTSKFILNYHLKKMCVCSYVFKQIFVIYFDIVGFLWIRMMLYVTCSRNTHFADSSIQHTQMKHGIKFNDNTLQEQQVYSKVITLI